MLPGCVFAHRLLRALRWPFGLPFGREHFVVITDLHRLFLFRRQYEQYGQFIDVDKSKLIVNMKILSSLSVLSSKKRNLSKSVITTKCSRPNGSPKGKRKARSNLCAKLSLAAISAAPYGACGVVGAVAQGFR